MCTRLRGGWRPCSSLAHLHTSMPPCRRSSNPSMSSRMPPTRFLPDLLHASLSRRSGDPTSGRGWSCLTLTRNQRHVPVSSNNLRVCHQFKFLCLQNRLICSKKNLSPRCCKLECAKHVRSMSIFSICETTIFAKQKKTQTSAKRR